MSYTIEALSAMEILDSRGRPTLSITCALEGNVTAQASVPSGASTGSAEALELRDGDPRRHCGKGCRRAAANVAGPIAQHLVGRPLTNQAELDRRLIELDGTPHKGRLGANAILGVSLAFARACAMRDSLPLYEHFARLADLPVRTLPRLTVNLFSGGKHAGGQIPVQDVLLVPVSASTIDQGLADICAVYQSAADLIHQKYQMRLLTADEGGLAPPFESAPAMLDDAVAAIRAAGLEPGRDMALAIDVASSHFYRDGLYHLGGRVGATDAKGMIQHVAQWVANYPIVSVEDALSEEDWVHWPLLHAALSGRAITLGDDFLCTNPARIRRAQTVHACDALLLKVNQIGTLTEAAEALRLARHADWRVTISARSGETEDHWLADLSVGWSGDQIKVGSVTQSERLAKYNRLLEIEAGTRLPVVAWP